MPDPIVRPDPIAHVVVLMMENHSFDQMLGSLAAELGLDGIDPKKP
ncbi:MAG: alkaline phosphatase family protein, partial [Candidatus Angelobacter sp.]